MPNLVRLITLTLLLLTASGGFALEIKLRPNALVGGAMVTLGELAELDAEAVGLADVRLLDSPEPGQEKSFAAAVVKQALLQRAPEMGQALWSGAAAVTVRRDGQVIDRPAMERILEDYLQANRGVLPPARISFKNLQFPPTFVLPRGRLSTEVIPSEPQILGSRRFSMVFRINGETVRNLSLRGELEAIAPVVVAAADLNRNVVLTERDLNLVEMDLAGVRNPCFKLEEIVGKKLKRPLRQGTPLDVGSVEFPPTIKRGELVTIILRRGAIQLTAQGQALQDGLQGEAIRVRNSNSQRDILGKVVEPGVVRVEQ
jgi:flagella basal body P-ring formation protein FlgA